MAIVFYSPQDNVPPATGDGGNVGKEEYLELVLGPPHFAPYKLPANILINKIVCKSTIDQVCSVVGIKADSSMIKLVPAQPFYIGTPETFAPNIHVTEELTVDSFDANEVEYLYVTIVYQKFLIG